MKTDTRTNEEIQASIQAGLDALWQEKQKYFAELDAAEEADRIAASVVGNKGGR